MPGAFSEFIEPWKDPTRALVIDPFSENPMDWEEMKREARLVGIIHKATSGSSSMDSRYFERKSEAESWGYLWGSYHWALRGEPVKQADYYIDTVRPNSDEVLALDLEDVTSEEFMSVAEAETFIEHVKVRTNRYPLIYANHKVASILTKLSRKSVFTKCGLWYARFLKDIPDFPKGLWPTYTLWQFSSEILAQYRIPGTLPDIDVNVFNGTADTLRTEWPFTRTNSD